MQSMTFPIDIVAHILQGDVHELLDDAMEFILNEAQQEMGIALNDRVAIVISSRDQHGQPVYIRIPFTRFSQVSAIDILDRVVHALNSYQELGTDIEVRVVVLPTLNLTNVAGGISDMSRGDMGVLIRNKRGIVEINPPLDLINEQKHCFEQWLVIGLAQLVSRRLLSAITMGAFKISGTTYNSFVKSRHKFVNRKRAVEQLRQVLQLDEISEQLLRTVERTFGVHLVLFSIYHEAQIQFPPHHCLPYLDARPVIVGLLRGRHIQKWEHVDFVSNPKILVTKDGHRSIRFCQLCFSLYERKQGCARMECKDDREVFCGFCHICKNTCQGCHSLTCGYVTSLEDSVDEKKYEQTTRCVECRTVLYSKRCAYLHLFICHEMYASRCELCGFKEHRGLKCGEIRCYVCSDIMRYSDMQEHVCYLKAESLKSPSTRIAVYDFECALNEEQIHIPYLCTLWFPYGTPHGLAEKYCTRLLAEHEVNPVFIFWGMGNPELRTGVYEFFKCILERELTDYVLFAHNARAYDAILVKHFMTKYQHEFSQDIQRGQKLLSMKYVNLKLEFRDSLCFIPTALRSMAGDFGIEELKKGFFPHRLITTQFMEEACASDFIVLRPGKEWFDMDHRAGTAGVKEAQELEQFFDQFYGSTSDELWNMKEDSICYCISDTVLLGKTLVQFREKLMEMTETMERPFYLQKQPFDPLSYVTLPSAMMGLFMSQFIPLRKIAVIDRGEVFRFRRAEAYLLWIEFSIHGQLKRINRCVGVDEYLQHMYIYRDCFMDGCLHCYGEHQRNERSNTTFGQCRFLADARIQILTEGMSKVIIVWDHDFQRLKETEPFELWYHDQDIEDRLPLDPRDSYKGGKVEAYKLSCPGSVQMCDFVSDYPGFCLGETYDPFDLEHDNAVLEWHMPTGQPKQLYRPPQDEIQDALHRDRRGIIKCKVLAPRGLYVPFLGFRIPSKTGVEMYELLYGLCRECMRHRLFPCDHMDVQRAFVGTWTLSEIHYALDLGYKLVDVIDLWVYPSSDNKLFRSFIAPFVVEKIKSKRDGLINDTGTFTPKGLDICAYVKELTGETLQTTDFVNSPAKRFTAKIAMNSVTGKFGQMEEQISSRTFTSDEYEESRKLLTDPSKDILFAEILDEAGDIVIIEYRNKRWTMRGARRKNDIIVAHITAYGRMILHALEDRLGDALLYVDTDSAFHRTLEQPVYKHGFRIGDLELELANGSDFVCCGRKWYSYFKGSGNAVCKLKGFTLKQSTEGLFHPRQLFKHLLECKQASDENQSAEPLTIDIVQFKTERENTVTPFKRTIRQRKEARFQALLSKRHILFPKELNPDQMCLINTIPYGF